MTAQSHCFRIFLSYSREDVELVEKIDQILRGMQLHPVWDRDIWAGTPFTDAIRVKISTAHVFMPVITRNSADNPWVHQEIGFAVGIGIPVLPLALDTAPAALIAQVQAITVSETLDDLTTKLKEANLSSIVAPAPPPLESQQVADYPEQRTELMVRYAQFFLNTNELGHVRQRAIFSSFSLPTRGTAIEEWQKYAGKHSSKTAFMRDYLERERETLAAHAEAQNCSLIVNPYADPTPVGVAAHQVQIEQLIEFLKAKENHQVTIVVSPRARTGNLTIVGDRFSATAIIPRPELGYEQTLFTTHGPTVYRHIKDFDGELRRLLEMQELRAEVSRDVAIDRLQERSNELSRNAAESA